jgi:hypothetical protein
MAQIPRSNRFHLTASLPPKEDIESAAPDIWPSTLVLRRLPASIAI